jgi:hypothetical protein
MQVSSRCSRSGWQPTEQVPRPAPEEFSLGDMLLVFENEFEVYRILDHHTRWKSRDRDLICLESEQFLAMDEPFEQGMSGLQELDRVTQDRQRMGWSPEEKVVR